MAVTTGIDPLDDALDPRITKYLMLKVSGAGNIGTNDDANQPFNNYFSSEDIGVIQSTAFLQNFNPLEFRAGDPEPNVPWIEFLTPAGFEATKSADFGGIIIEWDIAEDNLKATAESFCDEVIASINANAENQWYDLENGGVGALPRFRLQDQLKKANSSFAGQIRPDQILNNLQYIKDHPSSYTEIETFDTRFPPFNPARANNLRDTIATIYGSDSEKANNVIDRNISSFYQVDAAFQTLESSLFEIVGDRYLTPVFENFLAQTPYPNLTSGVHVNFNTLSGLNLTGLYSQVTGNEFNPGDIVSVTPEGLEFSPPPAAAFTDLLDTPADIVPSGFVRGDKDGMALEYSDINLVSGDIKDIPIPQGLPNGSGYLYANWSEGVPVLSWSPSTAENTTINSVGSEFFTGLQDTPSNYQNGLFLSSTVNGIIYSDINDKKVSFAGLSDTPDVFSAGKFMRSSANSIEFVDAPASGITGLIDTPNNFNNASEKYLRVNNASNAVEFIDISGEISSQEIDWKYYNVFADLPPSFEHAGMFTYVGNGPLSGAYVSASDKWVKIGSDGEAGSSTFTGLTDTPSSYTNASGKYLQVKGGEDGVEFSDPPVLNVANIADLPANPASGRLATVGCDLYIGCNNQWQKFSTEGDDDPVTPAEGFPDCVNNVTEQVLYNTYKQDYIDSYRAQMTEDTLRDGVITPTHEVCVYTSNPKNTAIIESTTPAAKYKWGMFYGEQATSISGSAGLPNISFSRWRTSPVEAVANIVDPTSAVSEIFIDQSMDIYADFQGVSTDVITIPNTSVGGAPTRLSYSNNILVLGDYVNKRVDIFKVELDGSVEHKQTITKAGDVNFGIAVGLSDSGELLAVSDYRSSQRKVYLYKKQNDDTFAGEKSISRSTTTSFATELDWAGENSLYATAHPSKTVYAYDIDYDAATYATQNANSTLTDNAINGFGGSVSVLSDQRSMVVAGLNDIVVCGRGNANFEWNTTVFNLFQKLTTKNGYAPPTSNTNGVSWVQVAMRSETVLYASYIGTTIDGKTNAGAVFKFENSAGTWNHTETIASDNPVQNGLFGINLIVRGSQLFILESASYKVYVKNL